MIEIRETKRIPTGIQSANFIQVHFFLSTKGDRENERKLICILRNWFCLTFSKGLISLGDLKRDAHCNFEASKQSILGVG